MDVRDVRIYFVIVTLEYQFKIACSFIRLVKQTLRVAYTANFKEPGRRTKTSRNK
jgi:hypothetical protein